MADTSHAFGKWLASPPPGQEVVISGIAGRLPECDSTQDLKYNLEHKIDMVTADERRWKVKHPEVPSRCGKINHLEKMDAGYFGLHYRQAHTMDPMIRTFLQTAVEAIVDAGVNPSELAGSKTGVFVGSCAADIQLNTLQNTTEAHQYAVTGCFRHFIATRLSYFLKLRGPSCVVDSACSSSLNAMDLAVKSIRAGQCESALVGAATLMVNPGYTREFYRLGVLSNDGTCKVFDESANGYVRSESVCCVFLQKAKSARRIYARIVYCKSNVDGFKHLGITFPSSQMQQELMTEVLNDSGKRPADISYIEAHGTGTTVGDPEEVDAIDVAIAQKRTDPLLTGSIKCSIGHTEPVSGLCSLFKVIFAFEGGFISPNIHLKNIKKAMTGILEKRIKVVTDMTPLVQSDALVAINNFGFGGNNCQLLVQRHTKVKKQASDNIPRLVCVSGRTKEAVSTILKNIDGRELDYELVGLLHQIYKQDFENHVYRGYSIVSKNGPSISHVKKFDRRELLVVFGSFDKTYQTLGQYLLQFPVFKSIIQKIGGIVDKSVDFPDTILKNSKSQSVSLIVQIAIVELLKVLELEPTAVYGHSVGNLAAAYYRNDISLKEAVNTILCITESKELLSKLDKTSRMRYKKIDNLIDLNADNGFTQNCLTRNKCVVLNISDRHLTDTMTLGTNNNICFLETLGRLYEEGYTLQIHKLYPPIAFPVSRTTPMISPILKWDLKKDWYTFKFGHIQGKVFTQQKFDISTSLRDEDKYMTGHVIDGRNLVPATEYLMLVWKTFLQGNKLSEMDNVPVVFENCKFIRAIPIPKSAAVHLTVTILEGSGKFEVVEKEFSIVTGRIYFPKDVTEELTSVPPNKVNLNREHYLEQDEVYRELYLRGYNYSGLFKGIQQCNVDASAALVRWDDNWTTFLDQMLQLKILQMDTRSLYVPTAIKKLIISPIQHLEYVEQFKDYLCPVSSYKSCDIIKFGDVEVCGLKATAIARKKTTITPILEKYVFVPNETALSLEESSRVIAQIILENSLETNFKAVEIVDNLTRSEDYALAAMSKAISDVPLIKPQLIISSKKELQVDAGIRVEDFVLTSSSNLLLVVGTNLLQRQSLFNQVMSALSKDGYILTREDIDFVPSNVDILTQHFVGNEQILLLKKSKDSQSVCSVRITSKNFEWLPRLQNALQQNQKVVVYCENECQEGILGLVNCLRREPGGRRVKCFFMLDQAPAFDIQHSLYRTQLQKDFAFNVYQNQKWGTYRHLLLEDLDEVHSQHILIQNTVKGDLSSLRWVQGNLKPNNETSKILVYPYYCSLNFKDVMVASGRVNVDTFLTERIEQEFPLGFEFCGVDTNGRRVMGINMNKGISTMVTANSQLLWDIPEHWTFEDAATVPIVYATVLYALLREGKMRRGSSILIHSATGGIGLSALNVCTFYKCDIYVTVGTEEKRQFIKRHYPHIPENHIGNSRNTSFEKMIHQQTHGRGVDIVLNSLSEEKLQATVRCLAPKGRFLEIGKYDLQNNNPLDLIYTQKKISYHAIMLDQIIYDQEEEIKSWISQEIHKGIQAGYIKPLPRTVFQKEDVIKAFKYLTLGTHIGKVVIRIRNEEENNFKQQLYKAHPRFNCEANKSYIIVGGLGGFGLELADWLHIRGAKHILLVSRSGIKSGYQRQRIEIWKAAGVNVQISTQDVTTEQGCINLIREAQKPVEAIFNLAVVLKDALFENQTEELFKTSLGPKAQATLNLDQASRKLCPELRYFVAFSSVSCGRGNTGQTNYGMANSIIERICEQRKRENLPGLAIQWGAIGDVGLVAQMQKQNKELVIGGTLQQKITSCMEVLDKFLNQPNPVVSSIVVAKKSDKEKVESLVEAVAYVLGIKNIKSVSPHTMLTELGMDSMMSTEITQILEKDFGVFLTTKEVQNMSFAKLMEFESNVKNDIQEAAVKTAKGTEFLLKCLPHTNSINSPIYRLPSLVKETDKANTVFVLPGLEGVFQGLDALAQNIKGHVLGVQYNYYSKETTIETYAKAFLNEMEDRICREGKFLLVGYSFGAAVAIEIARILEQKGFKGILVAIDGSPAYITKVALQNFPQTSQAELEVAVLSKVLSCLMPLADVERQQETFLKCKSMEERLQLTASQLSSQIVSDTSFIQRSTLTFYNRVKSMIGYKFNGPKLKTETYLYKAKSSLIPIFAEDYQMSDVCEKVNVSSLDGNHSTILEQRQLANDINSFI